MRPLESPEAGGALLPTLVTVLVLSGLSALIFTLSLSHSNEVGRAGREMRALYVAEAGLGEALLQVSDAVREGEEIPPLHGTAEEPIELSGGRFWATMRDNADDTYTIVSTGSVNGATRTIESVLKHAGLSAFDHAVFAGSTGADPTYTLTFGGRGKQKDEIEGNVYSANDISVTGDASINGEILATGTISGIQGKEGETRPLPDIQGMEYEKNHDVNVAKAFAANGKKKSSALGGNAFQVPETDPAHIFRKNPDNRTEETSGTIKDDYFLEDPYMPMFDFKAWNGNQGHSITLAGAPKKPGKNGNGLVYYIDGNLWVHNKTFLHLRLVTQDSTGTRITFIVKGNIYFCDDVLLQDPQKDGVAFIAIKDAKQPQSGDIYFGDPRFGTLERMHAYMYAEDDFHDNNLSATGSAVVELFGNMTAGDQVSINRDYKKKDGSVQHSKLDVTFDDRLSKGSLKLPGIPRVRTGIGGFQVVFWREVALQ